MPSTHMRLASTQKCRFRARVRINSFTAVLEYRQDENMFPYQLGASTDQPATSSIKNMSA
eukprot:7762108-Pyramimonas_sp.AAC.1